MSLPRIFFSLTKCRNNKTPTEKYMLGVYNHIVLFVVGYPASFLFRTDKETKDLTLYGWLAKR